jgi:hypothetical protein
MSLSLIICQMILVISSPSISTTGLATLILLPDESSKGKQQFQLLHLYARKIWMTFVFASISIQNLRLAI